jgi:hypothetical protein
MTYQHVQELASLQGDPGQPLIGVIAEEQGHELDSAPLAGYLHGRKPFVELITPLIQHRQAATSIMVYAEVIEYLKGLSDFTHRKK